MKLLHISLENVCQHLKLSHDFSPGMNGIVGRNGSGKTNLLKSIEASLTNEIANAGKKDANISQLAESDGVSRIVATFEHGDDTLEIVRSLRGSKSQLKISSGGIIYGDTKITAEIAERLGVDAAFMSDYVFVPQRKLFDFLIERPAERSRSFQRLFGLDRADELYKLLGKELAATPEMQVLGDTEELKTTIAAAEVEVAQLQEQLASLPAVTAEELKTARAFITAADQRRRDITERRRLRLELVGTHLQVTSSLVRVDAAESALQMAKTAMDQATVAAEAA